MVWLCADAGGCGTVATATRATRTSASRARNDVMPELPPGRKVALTLARLPGQNHPLLARPTHHRARRRQRPFDSEARREEPTHLGLRHRKRGTAATATDRKEAGEEPAAWLEDGRHRLHVLASATRIDRA